MYKMINGEYIELTESELKEIENKQLEESLKVNYEYPKVSEEKENIALLTIENENLKDRIIKLEGVILNGNN